MQYSHATAPELSMTQLVVLPYLYFEFKKGKEKNNKFSIISKSHLCQGGCEWHK